jgi:signal transduction histidine kinase
MSVLDVTILTAALVNLVLSATVYFHSRRQLVATIFGSFALSVSLWSLATFLMTTEAASFELFRIGTILHYISGNLVFWSLFWFSVYFPSRRDHSLFLPLALSAANALILISILTTTFLFVGFKNTAALPEKIIFSAIGYVILSTVTVFMFALSQLFLARKYLSATGEEKTQIAGIIAATLLTGSLGLVTNLILPGFGNFSLFYLGPIITTPLFVGVMIYAILKYRLFNLRVIAAEIFTAFLVVALVAELFLSNTSAEIGTRSVILLIAGIIGVVLIRSVYREIKAREEIERLNQSMQEFVAITSHQIRSPLTHIKAALSTIREGTLGQVDPKATAVLSKVSVSTERLITLVNDLLDMSSMESGKMQYNFAEFDFAGLVDSVAAEFIDPAKEKAVILTWQKPTQPIIIKCDERKLRQVVFNLVDNALKYTQKGFVEIKLIKEVDAVELSVKDSGVGMSPETIAHLFEKFSRAKTGAAAKAEGTGLGLYVAKRIVNDHQSELWAESEGPGRGSVFHLRLLTNRANLASQRRSKEDDHLAKAA